MKRFLSAFIALALIMCSCALASSLLEKSKDFYYNDAADVLEYEAKAEIYFNNKNLEKATGSQIVIATVRSTGSLTTDIYADRLFNTWGVGDKKRDNGFLLLMVITQNPDDGDYWLSQGSGTGDIIDPGEIGDYLYEYLEPDFARGRYSEGARKIFRVMFEHVRDYYELNLTYMDYDAIEESGLPDSRNSGFTAQNENKEKYQNRADALDFKYRVHEDGTAEITDYGGNAETLDIPAELNGIKVTGIGDYAFSNCDSLTLVTIPDSVTSVGKNPFINCRNLAKISVSPEHEYLAVIDGALFSKPDRQLVCCPMSKTGGYTIPQGIRIIGDSAFSWCGKLSEVKIPGSVTSIDKRAFYECGSLDTVTIPSSVMRIGDDAFSGCWKLTSVTVSDGVKSIGDRAFERCICLTSVTIPASVTSIGVNPFVYCENLAEISVSPDNEYFAEVNGALVSVPDMRLVCCPADKQGEYAIPRGIRIIGEQAFQYCDDLTSVTIPEGVTSMGDRTFYSCCGLTSVTIPEGMTRISDEAFSSCYSLTSVTIPAGVTSIGSRAFANCLSLTSVTIPDSVTSIGDRAFSYCDSLTSLTVPAGVTNIGDNAFSECKNLTVTVTRGSFAAEYCKDNGIDYTYPDALDWLKD